MSIKQKESKSKKVRKGDRVKIIAGNYKDQTGTVLRNLGDKIVVQGINLKKKHVKPTQQNPKGNILTIEHPIHISNVKVCPEGDTAVKLKVKEDKDGNRSLSYMQNGQSVVYREIKKPAS